LKEKKKKNKSGLDDNKFLMGSTSEGFGGITWAIED
jgi:hypothetical protein